MGMKILTKCWSSRFAMIINQTEKHAETCMVDQLGSFDSRDSSSLAENDRSEDFRLTCNSFYLSLQLYLHNLIWTIDLTTRFILGRRSGVCGKGKMGSYLSKIQCLPPFQCFPFCLFLSTMFISTWFILSRWSEIKLAGFGRWKS